MKQLRWMTVAFVAMAMATAGCDKGAAPEAGLGTEEGAAAPGVAEAGQDQAPAAAAAPTPVAEGAADLANKALAEVAVVDRPMETAGAMCELTGAAGETVECAVNLGVEADGIAARALQGTIAFDGKRASMKGFLKPGAGAEKIDLGAAGASLQSGHILKSTPVGDAAAAGRASFMVMNMAAPQTAISDAKADSAATIFHVAFVLSEDVRADDPIKVSLGNIVVADEAANQVTARVDGATIVTGNVVKK